MKKLMIVLFALAGAPLFADVTVGGQADVQVVRVTYGSDSAHHILQLGGQVFRDTSTTDTAGQWKRQDNTADSCSNPFRLYAGQRGQAIWKFALYEEINAVDPDSSTTVYRVQVRRNKYGTTEWGPWVLPRQSVGYSDITVQDSVLMPNVRVASSDGRTARYGLFFLGEGIQARLCPDEAVGTGNAAGDSVRTRNTLFIAR